MFDGQTYILRVKKSLDFTNSMGHSILCSNKAISSGIIVENISEIVDIRQTFTQSIIFQMRTFTLIENFMVEYYIFQLNPLLMRKWLNVNILTSNQESFGIHLLCDWCYEFTLEWIIHRKVRARSWRILWWICVEAQSTSKKKWINIHVI